jgi:FixJ family two-component response regulator
MMPGNIVPNERPPAAGALISVVDDDASILHSVGRLLRSADYTVQMFGSARQFLASLNTCRPQCLVLDVHMPEMTGLELQDWLMAQGFHVPIIFMTAYDTPPMREHARRTGSFGLFLKPFDKEELLRAIRKATASRPNDPAL